MLARLGSCDDKGVEGKELLCQAWLQRICFAGISLARRG
jgi:hypothetical protein